MYKCFAYIFVNLIRLGKFSLPKQLSVFFLIGNGYFILRDDFSAFLKMTIEVYFCISLILWIASTCLFFYLFKNRLIYFILWLWVFCLHTCICTICMSGTLGVRRRHWSPRNWSYGWLWATIWVLRAELRCSARMSTLSCRDIFPMPIVCS